MQLIYRAARFNFSPATVAQPKMLKAAPQRLMYRGWEFNYQKAIDEVQAVPQIMNWRVAQVCQPLPVFAPAHV